MDWIGWIELHYAEVARTVGSHHPRHVPEPVPNLDPSTDAYPPTLCCPGHPPPRCANRRKGCPCSAAMSPKAVSAVAHICST